MSACYDDVLDAIDAAPVMNMFGHRNYCGPVATVKWLSGYLGRSETWIRTAVHDLNSRGLVEIHDVLNANTRRRHFWIVGEAS